MEQKHSLKMNIKTGKKAVPSILDKIGDIPINSLTDSADDGTLEKLYAIKSYLPVLFQDESEDSYISALLLAEQTSYENGLYQFACVQYHMLFMTAVYFVLLKISMIHKEELDKALYYLLKDHYSEFYSTQNTKEGKLYFGSFAAIGESEVFLLLRVVGLDDSLLDILKKRVKERNNYAHANGHLLLTSDELFFEKIDTYNTAIEKVINLMKSDIVSLYKLTITDPDFYDPDIRAYIDTDEQIVEEFVKAYSLSRVELNWLRKIKTEEFKECKGFEHIKNLHIALCHYYAILLQDDEDYHPIEDEYMFYKYHNRASDFVENELSVSAYVCGKEGSRFPVFECPDCEEEQLAYDSGTDKYHCFSCDADYVGSELSFCSRCGRIMKPNGTLVCNDCFEDMIKD